MKILLNIGSYTFYRCPRLVISGRRGSPLNGVAIVLPDPSGEFYQAIKERDIVTVDYGYRGDKSGKWNGTVRNVEQAGKGQICIKAIGAERALSETIIKQAWKDESPDAIVKYAVNQSSLALGKIEKPGPVFPHFVASSIPVWQVARQCAETLEKAFAKDMSKWALWLGAGGVNWGDFDEPGEEPEFKTGDNIISHLPGAGMNELNLIETFLLPGFMHSMRFMVNDTKRGINESYRAEMVDHVILPKKARTFIGYANG